MWRKREICLVLIENHLALSWRYYVFFKRLLDWFNSIFKFFSEKGHDLESFDNSLQVPANNMGDSRRGSNYSLCKLNKTERAAIKHEKEIDETLHVTSLTHVLQVPVEKKDFSKEIRATKDIKDFVEKSEVMSPGYWWLSSVVDLEEEN